MAWSLVGGVSSICGVEDVDAAHSCHNSSSLILLYVSFSSHGSNVGMGIANFFTHCSTYFLSLFSYVSVLVPLHVMINILGPLSRTSIDIF
jgi:hypothetical protein